MFLMISLAVISMIMTVLLSMTWVRRRMVTKPVLRDGE